MSECLHVYMCAMRVPAPCEGEGTSLPDTGEVDCCLPPCEYWELNTGSLQEQKVLLTSETFLCPLILFKSFLILMHVGVLLAEPMLSFLGKAHKCFHIGAC